MTQRCCWWTASPRWPKRACRSCTYAAASIRGSTATHGSRRRNTRNLAEILRSSSGRARAILRPDRWIRSPWWISSSQKQTKLYGDCKTGKDFDTGLQHSWPCGREGRGDLCQTRLSRVGRIERTSDRGHLRTVDSRRRENTARHHRASTRHRHHGVHRRLDRRARLALAGTGEEMRLRALGFQLSRAE